MKLQAKLLSIIIPIIATFITIVGLFSYFYIINNISDDLLNKNETALAQISKNIISHVKKTKNEIKVISKNDKVQDYINSDGIISNRKFQVKLIDYIEKTKIENLKIKELYIFNDKKEIDFLYNQEMFYNENKDIKWIDSLLSKKHSNDIVSCAIIKASSGIRFVYVSKVKQLKEDKDYYIVFAEDVSSISNYLYNANEQNKSSVVLFNEQNVLSSITNSDKNEKILSALSKFDLSKDVPEKLVVENSSFYPYVKKINGNFILVNVTSKDRMFSEMLKIGIMLLLFGLFLIGLLSLIIYQSINGLVLKPIGKIKKISEEISNGKYGGVLKTHKQDELSDLSKSINNMSIKIQDSNGKINDLAYFDELTGLGNKRNFNLKFKEKIEIAKRENSNVSLMILDLDDFKEVNDLFGHHMGDKFLKEISIRISSTVNEYLDHCNEFFISRISGDEFIIMLCGDNITNITNKVADSVIYSLSKPLLIEEIEFYSSASLGVSIFPIDGDNEIDIFKNADMAMYEAKKKGKNQHVNFESRMLDKVKEKESINSDLRKALAAEDFELYFQPKYNIARGDYSQFEALIRWNHKEKGFISPALFIPYAEESSLIIDIGNWVIASVCSHVNKLEKRGWTDFKISFNVSFKQMQDKRFVNILKSMIYKYGINPEHLEMEITEYTLAKNVDHAIVEMTKIRNLGVSIALDDFGTGYSSMSYLQNLPLDTLKIDRAFVSKSTTSQKDRTIIETIITLAKGLSLKTVAEGVETSDEYHLIKELGCDLVQGYYFHKPLEFNDILNLNCDKIKELKSVT
jgi:diguanylate cyclase (GGDEF)-like protein